MSGLTKLLEGQKEASQGAGSRKENRRETWCPGAQGEGDLCMHPSLLPGVSPCSEMLPSMYVHSPFLLSDPALRVLKVFVHSRTF